MQPFHFRPTPGAGDAPALLAIHDARQEADGVRDDLCFEYRPSLNEYREKLASSPDDWIVVQSGSDVVGYGHTLHSWREQNGKQVYLHLGWVTPSARGKGAGRELLSRLEARCREKMARDGTLGNAEYAANASGTETSTQNLLRRTGYAPIYTVIEMRFEQERAVPVPPLPDGLTLRPVLPEHHRALWQCIGDAYYVHGADTQGREVATEDDFNRYFNAPSADPSLWFAAWEQSRIAGVVLCRVENSIADVYEVSVAHTHRRKGLARALLTRALGELSTREPSAIRLITWRENPSQAWRLYEAVGFRTVKDFPRWRKPLTAAA